jgi:hypothetical protein
VIPVFGLHTTVWACALVAVLGFGLVDWAVAPHKGWVQYLRLVALLSISVVGCLAFWSAFLRFPSAVVAILMLMGGMQVQDLRYWLLLLLGLVVDFVATVWCLSDAIVAWGHLHDESASFSEI